MNADDTSRPTRVFLAGGSGVIGRRLIPKLVAEGYEVAAMTRSPEKADLLQGLRAVPVVCDALDAEALRRAVTDARPDVVINQLTDLPASGLKPRKLSDYYAKNNRIRREGTDNLVAAARASAARRYIGQSIAFWYDPTGTWVKQETDPLWVNGPEPIGEAVRALAHAEEMPLSADVMDAVILRYGVFYGPGTWYSAEGEIGRLMRKRQYPNIGAGAGMTSFIHVDDAADACVAFVARGEPGVYNVVDDEPATANDWMPVFARAVGARPPLRVPAWLAKPLAGSGVVEWTMTARGASNEPVKRELNWTLSYPSWRQGFAEGLT